MDKNFGGVIWTNHALSRMNDRKISQSDAWATWRNPQQSKKARVPGAWVYYRTYGDQRIEVVAKRMPPAQRAYGPKGEKEWIILSVWSRTIYGDSSRANESEKKEPIWKLMIKQILGR